MTDIPALLSHHFRATAEKEFAPGLVGEPKYVLSKLVLAKSQIDGVVAFQNNDRFANPVFNIERLHD